MQLTVIRLIMTDTIEQELYEGNKKRNVAEVSLNFSSSNQLGVQVSQSPKAHLFRWSYPDICHSGLCIFFTWATVNSFVM